MSFIIDDTKDTVKQHIQKHISMFGIEPYMIGMFWNNPIKEIENILQAIKDNIPYNEYNMLTKDEQKAFDEGMLLF